MKSNMWPLQTLEITVDVLLIVNNVIIIDAVFNRAWRNSWSSC